MTDPGEERLHVHVPAEIKRALEESDRTQKELVEEYLRPLAGGLDTAEAYERRLDDLTEREAELEADLEALQDDLAEVRAERERVREEYEQFQAESMAYTDRLDTILDAIRGQDGLTVYARREDLREAARAEYGRDTDENREAVVKDLRERAAERELGLEPSRFEEFGTAASTTAGRAPAADGASESVDGRDRVAERWGPDRDGRGDTDE